MIVVFAKTDDDHAVAVSHLLRNEHGEQAVIFDSSRFPTAASLTAHMNGPGSLSVPLVDSEGWSIDLQTVKSFWWRRPQPITVDARVTDEQSRSFAYSESTSALYGLLASCDGASILDIGACDAADYKPTQLKIAAEVGFKVPETLITNDPQQALQFRQHHDSQVVYKAFNQYATVWKPTRLLTAEDLGQLHNVAIAPVIFQTLVPGSVDLRVTVVGRKIYAAEFPVPESAEAGTVDYRLHLAETRCQPHTVPSDLIEKIHAFMAALGLEYGALDFRLTHDKEYVFFEINTGGEFLYVQHSTGQPIAQAMAAHLAAGKAASPTS